MYLSTKFIEKMAPERITKDITGELVRLMAMVWQWDGGRDGSWGLTTGIASWVQLRAGLVPKEWERRLDLWIQRNQEVGTNATAIFLE